MPGDLTEALEAIALEKAQLRAQVTELQTLIVFLLVGQLDRRGTLRIPRQRQRQAEKFGNVDWRRLADGTVKITTTPAEEA